MANVVPASSGVGGGKRARLHRPQVCNRAGPVHLGFGGRSRLPVPARPIASAAASAALAEWLGLTGVSEHARLVNRPEPTRSRPNDSDLWHVCLSARTDDAGRARIDSADLPGSHCGLLARAQ